MIEVTQARCRRHDAPARARGGHFRRHLLRRRAVGRAAKLSQKSRTRSSCSSSAIAATVISRPAFSPPEDVCRRPWRRGVVLAVALLCACSFGAFAREVTLSIGDLQAGGVSAQSVKARLRGANLEELNVEAERLSVPGHTWRKPRVTCARLELTRMHAVCAATVLDIGEKIPLSVSYAFAERQVLAEFKGPPNEAWRLQARLDGKRVAAEANIENRS